MYDQLKILSTEGVMVEGVDEIFEVVYMHLGRRNPKTARDAARKFAARGLSVPEVQSLLGTGSRYRIEVWHLAKLARLGYGAEQVGFACEVRDSLRKQGFPSKSLPSIESVAALVRERGISSVQEGVDLWFSLQAGIDLINFFDKEQ